MTDSENKESKSKVLGLKGGTNTVRQSFSHGRSKSVVVETRKKKLLISKKVPVVEEEAWSGGHVCRTLGHVPTVETAPLKPFRRPLTRNTGATQRFTVPCCGLPETPCCPRLHS